MSRVVCVVCETSFEWNEIPGPLPKDEETAPRCPEHAKVWGVWHVEGNAWCAVEYGASDSDTPYRSTRARAQGVLDLQTRLYSPAHHYELRAYARVPPACARCGGPLPSGPSEASAALDGHPLYCSPECFVANLDAIP